jgi:hypothetical protein
MKIVQGNRYYDTHYKGPSLLNSFRSILYDDLGSLLKSGPVTGKFAASLLVTDTGGTVRGETPDATFDDTFASLTGSGTDVGDSRAVLSERSSGEW